MAMIKKSEMKKMDPKEREKRLKEMQLELMKQKANISIGAPVTSPGKIKEMRRTIARLKASGAK